MFNLTTSLLLVVMSASGTAFAQQSPAPRTVARLTDIQGTVLVSQGDAMAAGTKDQALPVGARIVTTAGSKVTVTYDKGCEVPLEENQRFTVRDLGECAALIASIESIGIPVASAGSSGVSGLALLGAAGIGSAVVYGVGRTGGASVSPN